MLEGLSQALDINRTHGSHGEKRLGNFLIELRVPGIGFKEPKATLNTAILLDPLLHLVDRELCVVHGKVMERNCIRYIPAPSVRPFASVGIEIL